jgi:hypothetical protein
VLTAVERRIAESGTPFATVSRAFGVRGIRAASPELFFMKA